MTARNSVLAAVAAGIGASLCCVGPLVLVMLGIGGAWVAQLTRLEPYRPIFIALTVLFLSWAFWQLYRAPVVCAPGTSCANPRMRRRQRILFWAVSTAVAGLIAVPWLAPLFY